MPPDFLTAFYVLAAGAFGAVTGSFLNVCIHRLPRDGLSIHRPRRSFCPACGEAIRWYDNIPILSWFLLAGRCRRCGAAIPLRYVVVETLTAVLFALVVYREVVELGSGWGATLILLALVSGLIVASFIDIEFRRLPDAVTIGGMHAIVPAVLFFPELYAGGENALLTRGLLALADLGARAQESLPEAARSGAGPAVVIALAAAAAGAVALPAYRAYRARFLPEEPRRLRDISLAGVLAGAAAGLVAAGFVSPGLLFAPGAYALAGALAGMLAGSGLVYAVGLAGTVIFRKPAMGFGDVKLMGLLGALTGWSGVLAAFFIACLLGSIVGVARLYLSRDRYLPFGPFLVIGALFMTLWPDAFYAALAWYLGLF